MLKLLCGPSGSGKSTEITSLIRRDIESGIRCYLLVPEQQAYISERDLYANLPKNAGLYFQIVNFSGLCREVSKKFGGLTQQSADQLSRSVFMWETIRRLSGTFKQYNRMTGNDLPFAETMLTEIEELQNNGIDSTMLENAAASLPADSPLAKKLSDLAAIQATYLMLLGEHFGGNSTDQLLLLANVLKNNDFFAGSNFYIDSFSSFTMPEYAVLTQIISQCASVTIGLCIDSLTGHPAIHFRGIYETAKRLKKCADLADSPVFEQDLSAKNNQRPKALRILERDLWRFEQSRQELLTESEKEVVSLSSCPNVYEEAQTAALNILDLIGQGMHFGDIVVYMRNPDSYRGILDAALERYRIPYFFSERTELSSKPLARVLLSALRAVSKNFRLQDVVSLAKTGLCGVNDREIALFEDYCETWHINGSRFCEEIWNMNPDGLVTDRTPRTDEILETANRVRAIIIKPLQALLADFRQSSLLPDRCRAIYDYLNRIQIAKQLSTLAEEELKLGQIREAGESLRLYRLVEDSLVKLCQLLPDASVTVEEMLSLLEIVFSHSDLGSVPGIQDCVTIGSAATIRAENVQAAFLLGLCEGEFPQSVAEHGILSEQEKETLKGLGIDLQFDLGTKSAEELFYVYRAVTKPKQKLFLSYPVLGASGEPKTRSMAMRRVSFLLQKEPKDVDLRFLRENAEKTEPEQTRSAPLQPGSSLYLSKSKINTFTRCPYSYFSQYTLNLRGQKDSATTSADDGNFLHHIFQKVLEKAVQEDGSLSIPGSDEELELLVSEIVMEYLKNLFPMPLMEMDMRLIHLFARLQALSVIMLKSIFAEITQEGFAPRFFEEKLGGKTIPYPVITLSDQSKVYLTGKIDRVDLSQKGNRVFVRIVDYKTGSTSFNLSKVASGADMQLIIYLYAATQMDRVHCIPAAAHYLSKAKKGDKLSAMRSGFILDDAELLQSMGIDKSEESTFAGLELLSMEQITEMMGQVEENVRQIATDILSGRAEKTPSEDACKYCNLQKNCALAIKKKF